MRVAHINSVSFGSTGQIMLRQHHYALEKGDVSFAFWGRGRSPQDDTEFKYGTVPSVYWDGLQTRLDGRAGFHSKGATKRLLGKLDKLDPELVCLHNLHGYHVNVEMLFNWLASRTCKVVWTLHDCWAFTGHCAHYSYIGCDAWKTGCPIPGGCPQLEQYPKTRCGTTCKANWKDKKRLFTLIPSERMTLVTPSKWLAEQVTESFLGSYQVEVHPNKIDTDVFKPTPSDFRERYGIADKTMILGVASPWTDRKGLRDFVYLRERMDESFAICLVGLTGKQVQRLPKGIIGLERINDPVELAGIYSSADVLFNPSAEETYPTVNLEAQACGTPVVAYNATGNPETLYLAESRAIEPDVNVALEVLQYRGGRCA